MSIRSLFLVTLVVDDYDRALDFYCGIMGFDLVSDTPLEAIKRWVVVRPPGKEGAALLLARAGCFSWLTSSCSAAMRSFATLIAPSCSSARCTSR